MANEKRNGWWGCVLTRWVAAPFFLVLALALLLQLAFFRQDLAQALHVLFALILPSNTLWPSDWAMWVVPLLALGFGFLFLVMANQFFVAGTYLARAQPPCPTPPTSELLPVRRDFKNRVLRKVLGPGWQFEAGKVVIRGEWGRGQDAVL